VPIGTFEPFGFTHCLVPHFKLITTGVGDDVLEFRFHLIQTAARHFLGARLGDHRGGHRWGSYAGASAEALARYHRKGGRR